MRDTLASALASFLPADEATAFDVDVGPGGASVGFFSATPGFVPARAALERVVQEHPASFEAAGTACPEPRQRDVPLLRSDGGALAGDGLGREVLEAVGLADADWVRVLVCDGPVLLAWVGAFRRRGRFGDDDRAIVQRVVPALRQRLRLERQVVEAALTSAALRAALELVRTPCFVVRGLAHVEGANAAARVLLDADRRGMLALLGEAIAGRGARGAVVHRFPAGSPEHSLVQLSDASPSVSILAAQAARRWGLSERRRQVLLHLVNGRCNKDIAASLRCAERSVEAHVTALLERAGCRHRAELIACFWTGAEPGQLAGRAERDREPPPRVRPG